MTICGHQERPQGKGHGKNSVRETDQLEEARDGVFSRRIVFFDDHELKRLAGCREKFLYALARAGEDRCSVREKHAFESEFEKFAQ